MQPHTINSKGKNPGGHMLTGQNKKISGNISAACRSPTPYLREAAVLGARLGNVDRVVLQVKVENDLAHTLGLDRRLRGVGARANDKVKIHSAEKVEGGGEKYYFLTGVSKIWLRRPP